MNVKVMKNNNGGNTKTSLVRDGDGECQRFPFWGRILSMNEAAGMQRRFLHDLGGSPRFFVDGSGVSNAARADCCWAWLLQPMPAAKPEPVNAKGKQKATKPVEVATHFVAFEPLEIEVEGTQYEYQWPFLQDNPDHATITVQEQSKLMRLRTDLDEETIAKVGSKRAATSVKLGFALK